MTSNNVNKTGENSRNSTDVNSVLTQNQDFAAFRTAKEHIKLSEQVVRNQINQLKAKRAELVADPGNALLRRQINEIAETLRKTLADYNSERLEFLELQSDVLDVKIEAEQDIVKKTAMIYSQVKMDNEITKLKSECLLKQYNTLVQKTAEQKDKIEHIRTISKKVDQTAAEESLATAASSYKCNIL